MSAPEPAPLPAAIFTIKPRLPQGLEHQAATLYWQAFGPKLERLLGPGPRAVAYLTAGISHGHILAALAPDGALLGVAGFRDPSGGFATLGWPEMRAAYGTIGALWRRLAFRLLESEVDNARFLVDGIAVARDARGQGVGAALVAALCDLGRARGYRAIRLDVLPENIPARRLYEREGFAAAGMMQLGLAGHLIGVAETLTMVKPL